MLDTVSVYGTSYGAYVTSERAVTAVDHTLHTVSMSASDSTVVTTGGTLEKTIAQGHQLPHWMACGIDPQDGNLAHNDVNDTNCTQTFAFTTPVRLDSIKYYIANQNTLIDTSTGVSVFDTATITFSNDGTTFTSNALAPPYPTTAERSAVGSQWVTVPLNQDNAYKYFRVHLTQIGYSGTSGTCAPPGCVNWIFISAVTFQGDGASQIFQSDQNRIS